MALVLFCRHAPPLLHGTLTTPLSILRNIAVFGEWQIAFIYQIRYHPNVGVEVHMCDPSRLPFPETFNFTFVVCLSSGNKLPEQTSALYICRHTLTVTTTQPGRQRRCWYSSPIPRNGAEPVNLSTMEARRCRSRTRKVQELEEKRLQDSSETGEILVTYARGTPRMTKKVGGMLSVGDGLVTRGSPPKSVA
ncbi:hypothetical protein BDV95DRAFT_243451 [Massariosphaeria phaeospora]|uniref:Uncharacterized protein n=1 Tax=Massariosphaeria phaeospora TaxID=100035 RepID=A0A7C8M0F4_9PLEO|nr:hypothetical protein BDV95DRAFT_243451 [Massariosphaeria phaeospora]